MKTSLRSMFGALTVAGLLAPALSSPACVSSGVGGTADNGLPTESFVASQDALLAATRAPLVEARRDELGVGGFIGDNGLRTESFVAGRDALRAAARNGLRAR